MCNKSACGNGCAKKLDGMNFFYTNLICNIGDHTSPPESTDINCSAYPPSSPLLPASVFLVRKSYWQKIIIHEIFHMFIEWA